MPTKIFFELNDEKRNKIIEICIVEFSQYGYTNSSTNRITQNAGISKGSLFQYFQNKEELYFYILDMVTMELIGDLKAAVAALPRDLFERTVRYSELEFLWYIKHPEKFKLITVAFSQTDGSLRQKIENRYNQQGQDFFYEVLADIDMTRLKWDKKKTADILKWVLAGFKEEFISHMHPEAFSDIEFIQHEYVSRLISYMTILKSGLAMEESEE